MSTANEIFANTIAWGEEEELVRALVLVGSRAEREPADELADFDVAVFARTYEPYVQDDRWLSSIGHVWVYIPEQYDVEDEIVPTRLVVYEGGVKVDFAFHTMGLVTKVDWEGAYRVILDKDGIAAVIASLAHDAQRHPPVEQDLSALVREFWFEAYHVAKYLKRGELWLVSPTFQTGRGRVMGSRRGGCIAGQDTGLVLAGRGSESPEIGLCAVSLCGQPETATY
jgi:aminoglycoside 6-adenylyltransferase